jgi:tRNA modification GTPase
VGKSSLYNRIVGREAAIVTAVEGTTRDVLSETVALGQVTLRLFDTAGLHETADPVERIGIDRARSALDAAELVLAVFDGSEAPTREDLDLIDSLVSHPATVVAVINKSDRGESFADAYRARFAHAVCVSCEEGTGLDALSSLIEGLYLSDGLDLVSDPVITNARQLGAALAAHDAVQRALDILDTYLPVELLCVDTEAAMQAIAEVDGRAVSEDIVTQIFSRFCVGK